MPDIDILDIIKISIHTIEAEQTRGSDNCCPKMCAIEIGDPKRKQ